MNAGQRRCGLVLHQMTCREEQPLHQREDATVWLTVIDGSADDECIRVFHLLSNYTAHVIIECTARPVVLSATAAVDAHADGLAANLNNLRLYAVQAYFWRMLKLVGHKDVTLYEMQGYDHGAMPFPAYKILKDHIKRLTER